MKQAEKGPGDLLKKSLVIVYSYHHNNTEKIANVIAKVLDAPVKAPRQVNPGELREYGLIGFGSGIYGAKNDESLLDLAGKLPQADGQKVFIFSTFGAPAGLYSGDRLSEFIRNNHAALREKLQAKGYTVVDEFACPGLNTNSFLRLFGGLNKGRPGAEDFRNAEAFAENLRQPAGIEKRGTAKELLP